HWVDLKNAILVVAMVGNPADAHPVGFHWAMEAQILNGAKLIVIDPGFTRTASVADFYAPIRCGTDIAFLSGVMLYLLTNEKYNSEYTEDYTN
ncbi:molybdopterin-dependent oxidoreductase, partial [Salmonella enterica]|uniref:molybdopterin-dependent oxidoreductase n=1 Tax=Salmonella enterica TaxID=28901 RepID=UPI000CB62FFA